MLDTYAFLWWDVDDPQISDLAGRMIESSDNELLVSAASLWEIAIKVSSDKLVLPSAIDRYVPGRLTAYRFKTLPVNGEHALRVASLPPIHRDPFDRMLIAQALVEGIPIVTSDPAIGRYDVETIW